MNEIYQLLATIVGLAMVAWFVEWLFMDDDNDDDLDDGDMQWT